MDWLQQARLWYHAGSQQFSSWSVTAQGLHQYEWVQNTGQGMRVY